MSRWNNRGSVRDILAATSVVKGECIESTASNGGAGYGRIMIGNKRTMAHRLAYEHAYGPIPDGLIVRHKCDNPPCINPAHLELGTHRDNLDDRIVRMSGRRGVQMHTAKLTEDAVREVRRRVASGESRRAVARSLGVSHTVINALINGKFWRHVREES